MAFMGYSTKKVGKHCLYCFLRAVIIINYLTIGRRSRSTKTDFEI